jgi:Putative 2OG-Fe(II) oxygenase/Coenzyme PQQ synthesis protein D (PqqD)
LFADSVPDQPMAAMRPENPTLTSWTVAVNMDGHEEWHIHPDGWLSGVFYVDVPDLSATDAPHAGQIEFGPYPFGAAVDNAVWPRRALQPRTGDLLLFPSYFAHRTWPTYVARDRICIAFDVLRRGIDNPIETHKNNGARNDFGPDDRLARHGRTVCSATDAGSYMIMNVDTGRYLATDETGALLWKLLNEPHTTRELTGLLLREFDAVEAEMTRDVAGVLRVMVACDLAAVV